jgi:tRNA(Ile2)-agmatinylcytidine synthase
LQSGASMVLWIGVDDTDSLRGMCTTFLASELIRDLVADYDLIGFPRLVRLNPNIPWKTRGNGAICLRFGRGRGPHRIVGMLRDRPVLSFSRGAPGGDVTDIANRVAQCVERWSHFDDPTTHPGFAVLRKQPSARLYWRAVREVVSRRTIRRAASGLGLIRGYKGGRGIVGAVSAIAWRPRDRTYEVLAYRESSRWGTARRIEPQSVITMDETVPSTFNNYDYENHRVVIAPKSPCPILYGIRGDNPDELMRAKALIRGEESEGWLLFETNQGTDDHVRPEGRREPWATVRMLGSVSAAPRDLPGGHVVFQVLGTDVTAYEPSKQFRRVVRALVPGDQVEVIGAIRRSPRTLNLEKLRISSLAELTTKVANPWCTECGMRAKSMGRNAGYRCRACRRRFSPESTTKIQVPRRLLPGWYEPPVGSRRHLSKPLKRSEIVSRASC